jgi:hypothetical protein
MDIQFLKEALDYDPLSGNFIWKTRPIHHFKNARGQWQWNAKYAGTKSGTLQKPNSKFGYERIKIQISGKSFNAHRLAWIFVHNHIPDGMQIDHIDGDSKNNAISNLRLVTHSENHKNRGVPKSNTSGAVGVRCVENIWQARIKVDGKEIHLGSFDNFESAAQARMKASKEYGFTERHTIRTY